MTALPNRREPARSPRTRQLLPTAANSTRHPGLPQNWDSEIHCTHGALCRPATDSYPLLDPLDRKLTNTRAARAHPESAFCQTSEPASASAGSHCSNAGKFPAEPQWRGHQSEAPLRPLDAVAMVTHSPLPQEFTNSKCGRGGKRLPSPRSNSLLSWLSDYRFSPLSQRVPPAPSS